VSRMIRCFLFITVLLLLVSSCAAEPSVTTATSQSVTNDNPIVIKDNYWNLACGNTNVVLYKNLTGSRSIQFELVSAFPFDADELNLQLESDATDFSYNAECYRDVQDAQEIFPFYLYQCYQNMDWQRLATLARKKSENESSNSALEFSQMQNMFMDGYTTLRDQNKLPKLYKYVVGIGFNLDKLNSVRQVYAINLELNGESKRYVLDNLILDGEREFNLANAGISSTLAISDAPVNISKDGTLDLTYIDLQSPKSYQLTGLSLLDDDTTSIADCSVTLRKTDGTQIDMKWDGQSPIQVMPGESVRLDTKCIDTRLAGVMESVFSKYIQIQYITSDGDQCSEIVQGIYRMRQGLYDLYAAADGVNVLSFYLDYYCDH